MALLVLFCGADRLLQSLGVTGRVARMTTMERIAFNDQVGNFLVIVDDLDRCVYALSHLFINPCVLLQISLFNID